MFSSHIFMPGIQLGLVEAGWSLSYSACSLDLEEGVSPSEDDSFDFDVFTKTKEPEQLITELI